MKPLCKHCGIRQAWIDQVICGTCHRKIQRQEEEQTPEPDFNVLICRSCHANPAASEGLCEDCLRKSRITVSIKQPCKTCKKRKAKINGYCHYCYSEHLSANTA